MTRNVSVAFQVAAKKALENLGKESLETQKRVLTELIEREGAQAAVQGTGRSAEELMQVGDLARETGKTVRAIHLYEELQLLRPAARSKGRTRRISATWRKRPNRS